MAARRHSNRRLRWRLLWLLLPAGCANPPDRAAVALGEALTSARSTLVQAGVASPAPAGPATAARPVARPVGLVAVPAPVAAPLGVAELLGATPDALRRGLGEPALRRPEGAAEIWLYAAESCFLDLVLYPAAGGLRVAHATARAVGAASSTEPACLAAIADARAAPPVSAAAPPTPRPGA